MSAYPMLRAGALALVLSPLYPVPAWAGAERTCDATDGGTCLAYGGCYNAFWPIWNPPQLEDGYCWEEESSQPGTVELKFLNPDPPGTAYVVCEAIGDCRFSCTATPFGSGFTYAWSRSGPVFLDSTPAPGDNFAIYRLLNNNAATVLMTATSPSGQSSQAGWGILPGQCFPY